MKVDKPRKALSVGRVSDRVNITISKTTRSGVCFDSGGFAVRKASFAELGLRLALDGVLIFCHFFCTSQKKFYIYIIHLFAHFLSFFDGIS